MIILVKEIVDGEPAVLRLLDGTVPRNAFGRQLDSFEAELRVPLLGAPAVHGVSIRAPGITRAGPSVEILARLDDGRVVSVREGNVLATTFHLELAGETRFHRRCRGHGCGSFCSVEKTVCEGDERPGAQRARTEGLIDGYT